MNSAFNSVLEISMRLLLLLNVANDSLSIDELVVIDFVTVYAADFGISSYNLHGQNRSKESEFAARRLQSKEAISSLVVQGYAAVEESEEGFLFFCTPEGEKLCDHMANSYAADYTAATLKALDYVRIHGISRLQEDINRKALKF